jgi:NAD(P)-dependent dehydrogenase (short-subunit alcohol dehydrogenase family)
MSLRDQHVVVIGGTSGIGYAVAGSAVAAGATVTITGRDQARTAEAAARLGPAVRAEAVDAADQAATEDLFARTGEVHHLVLAAGGTAGGGAFRDVKLDDLRAGFEAKFWPHLTTLRAALDRLVAGGSVTFVTAVTARCAWAGASGYAALNGALEAMVPPLALELAPTRVNAVSPGAVDTPWWSFLPPDARAGVLGDIAAGTPTGRIAEPADAARAVRFLLESPHVTGIVIPCDGGASLAPPMPSRG